MRHAPLVLKRLRCCRSFPRSSILIPVLQERLSSHRHPGEGRDSSLKPPLVRHHLASVIAEEWVPAFAGMTNRERFGDTLKMARRHWLKRTSKEQSIVGPSWTKPPSFAGEVTIGIKSN